MIGIILAGCTEPLPKRDREVSGDIENGAD